MKRIIFFFSCLAAPALSWADVSLPVPSSPSVSVVGSSTTGVIESSPTVRQIHAIHLTASAAGSKRYRKLRLDPLLNNTMVNAVVIDIKEEEGTVYIPGVTMANDIGAYVKAIPDLADWLTELKKRGVYTIARIAVFKDNILPRKHPSFGVHNQNGGLWSDRKNITWIDPYNRDAWRYPHAIALQCAKIGFDEVQFDYIRFPTDGSLKAMHFSQPYSRQAASQTLIDFLARASALVHPYGTKVSIDVFGLTTSVSSGMGIGQLFGPMSQQVDFVCPMTYPSHYAKGEYGIPNPNDAPYRTIHLAMRDALKVLGPAHAYKLRPYFQDFSLKGRGIRYGPKEVRAQMQAAADLGVMSWSLWNASCHYTIAALESPFIPSTPITVGSSTTTVPAVSSTTTPSK